MIRAIRIMALAAAVVVLFSGYASAMPSGEYRVREVIDGDTVILSNGETVRYIGVDTPEVNEFHWLEARVRNMSLVLGRLVRVDVCGVEKRDKYGRVLAWVYSPEGDFVSETLIREGLGRALAIPPCGVRTAKRLAAVEAEAKSEKRGIWGSAAKSQALSITPFEAWMHVGEMVRMTGEVSDAVRFGDTWFLEFWPDDVKAVVMPRAFFEFERRGISLHSFKGRTVTVTGILHEGRSGLEILIDSPSRIEATSIN
ncbi:MAG: thermonuclease family protein [Deltaproteobacteria bacterium]|nr:thermonuclease family protein [Deltaproteobacteria bacterium]MCL4874089.1 thermonuclease family protein [bacterium]